MSELLESPQRVEISSDHEQLAWELFLKRWERLEPIDFDVWKTDYLDTGCDPDIRDTIASAYLFSLQEKKRFPNKRALYQIVDTILHEPDDQKRQEMKNEFIQAPDPAPRDPNKLRVGRFRRQLSTSSSSHPE